MKEGFISSIIPFLSTTGNTSESHAEKSKGAMRRHMVNSISSKRQGERMGMKRVVTSVVTLLNCWIVLNFLLFPMYFQICKPHLKYTENTEGTQTTILHYLHLFVLYDQTWLYGLSLFYDK